MRKLRLSRPTRRSVATDLAADTTAPTASAAARAILGLQRNAGNAAVTGLLRGSAATEGFAAIAHAKPKSGAAFYEKYEYPRVGFTTKVDDHAGPDLEYGTAQRDDGWFATPKVVSDSDEGKNKSWALAAGSHDVPEEKIDDLPIVLDVSPLVAARIAAAEDEHNADFRHARDRVLTPADAWLAKHLKPEYGPAKTEAAAQEMVDEHLNHALPEVLGLTAVEDFDWPNLGSYYARLSYQTEKRDDAGWHTFDYDEHPEKDRVRVELANGETQIGVHPPADVIRPGELT